MSAGQSLTTPPREPRIHWWSRPSPWLWGLLLVLLVAAVTLTQVPRIPGLRPAPAKPGIASTSGPALSGADYTQAMVGDAGFAGADLRGVRLEHLDLRGQDFQRANASGAIFAGSLLNGANLSHADLRGADLRGTCLRGATLIGAKLEGADFTGADVTGASVRAGATARAIGWGSIPGLACRRT